MKWSELTWKERKQIYDTVRADNPNVSYLDIKQQFDNIPEYEDGVMLHYADQDYINWKKRLPQNLQESYGYNLYGAYKSGAAAKLDEGDGYYHLPTRNPHTGEILKYPSHPTFYYGLAKDIELGYYPVVKGGKTYTIKAYENGKDKDAQAWKINETVRLGLEGRGVSQDSLQHIIDRANMQNPVKSYDPLAGSNEHLANLLGGLNKTVGTAATGASVLTMGLWNALRMLKLPKAEMLKLVRQGLAKQARTGQNVGNYADYGIVAEDLLRNEFDVNNIGQIVINQIAGKDLTKTRNKVSNLIGTALDTNDIVTSVAPSYENGKDIINFVNKSDANFVYRLKTPFRNTIDDWETQYISPYIGKPSMRGDWKYKSISTHKMGYGEPYGEPVVWPLVQEVNGKLIDFTRPPYHPWAALDNAEQTGDYIKFPTIDSAKWFTENYKNYYPSFENGKEGNPKLPIEYAVPLTIADLANANNTNNN